MHIRHLPSAMTVEVMAIEASKEVELSDGNFRADRQAFAKQKTTREGIFHLAPRLTVALVVVASSCSFHFFPFSVRRSAKMSAAPVPTGDGIGIANLPNQVRAHALPSFASCSPIRAHRGTKS